MNLNQYQLLKLLTHVLLLEVMILNVPIALKKGTRSCTQHPISKFAAYNHLSSSAQALITNLARVEILKTTQEALSILECRNAIREEMLALEKNRTWDVVEMLREKKSPIDYKWVFSDIWS